MTKNFDLINLPTINIFFKYFINQTTIRRKTQTI